MKCNGATLCWLYALVLTQVMFGLGWLMWMNNDDILQDTIANGFYDQVDKDWSAVPFTDIIVTDAPTCPKGTDLVFHRIWQGL